MRPALGRALALIALWLPACAQLPKPHTVSDHRGPPPHHVVFVADGAGDYRSCSTSIRETAAADHLPVEIVTYVWSHGYLHNLADHTDYTFVRVRGRELAGVVLAHRQAHPDVPVSLAGHSAGAGVALVAAEHLPPDSVERIVLLASSVSTEYDVRPALRATRVGIDNFYSTQDRIWLGLMVYLLGTTDDPLGTRASGRYGFDFLSDDPASRALYSKLRQHKWDPSLREVDHNGRHFGGYQPEHLRRYVLPLFE